MSGPVNKLGRNFHSNSNDLTFHSNLRPDETHNNDLRHGSRMPRSAARLKPVQTPVVPAHKSRNPAQPDRDTDNDSHAESAASRGNQPPPKIPAPIRPFPTGQTDPKGCCH